MIKVSITPSLATLLYRESLPSGLFSYILGK